MTSKRNRERRTPKRFPLSKETKRILPALALTLPLLSLAPWTSAADPAPDPVAAPPAPWVESLAPIPAADFTGAEPRMRDAIETARAQVADLLTKPDPDSAALARAYGRLGALLVLREVEAPAAAAFRNARTLDPKEFRWPYYAGYLALKSGNTDQALEALEAALSINPDYPPLALRLGKLRLDRNELSAAQAALQRAATTPGLAAAAQFHLGQIALLERRHQDAVRHLEAALSADPAATQCHWPLAQAYRALDQDDRARQHLAQVAPRAPVADDPLLAELEGMARQSVPAFERAVYAVDQRDFQTAVREFAAGLDVDPDNAAARVSYARVLYLTGDAQGADRELDLALGLAPDAPSAHFYKGLLAQAAGDPAAAADRYRRVLAQAPGHLGARYYLANLDFVAGRYEEAAAGYRKILDAPGAPAPTALLAVVAGARSGAADAEAARALEALVARSPGDPQVRYALIRLRAAARDPAELDPGRALALAAALAFEQPGPPALRALALSQAASGDLSAAAETLRQAQTLAGGWLPADLRRATERELETYRTSPWQTPNWSDDPLLAPPPLDAHGIIRDYPEAVPY